MPRPSNPSDVSKKAYDARIAFLQKAGVTIDDPKALMAFFEMKAYSLHSKRNYLTACLTKAKDTPAYEALSKLHHTLTEEMKKKYESQAATEEQLEKMESWEEITKKATEYIAKPEISLENKLMLGLYTFIPPVRVDYLSIKRVKELPKQTTGTYYISNESVKQIVIYDHKQSHAMGAVVKEVPTALSALLEQYFDSNEVLFNITPSAFSLRFRRLCDVVFHTPLSITSFRHSYITHALKGSMSLKDAKALAQSMGHSYMTQQLYRYTNAK
jgi:integrase